MIKSICWTTFFLFFQLALLAQQETYPCAASEMQRLLFEKTPTLLQRQLALDEAIQQQIQRQQIHADLRNVAVFTIPVVVHIIHQNGSENISDAQVQSAIQHLNDAFAHQGYYGAAGKGTNIPIQFCLAQRTPNNQATNGITRDVSGLTTLEMETDDAALKNINRWDSRQYVNIWVVRDINSKAHGSGVAGYAYYASAHGAAVDGIVCEARYFGNSPANDVVLIHEVGHYLNLYHTFEGGCTNNNCELEGDRVCDTPPDQAKHTGCVYNSCNTDADDARPVNPLKTDGNDLTENYLDYSPFSCQHAFTPGQSARMLAALQTVRASLLESPGCLAPCTATITADFTFPTELLTGASIPFQYSGTGGSSFEWKVNGKIVANQRDFSFVFTQPGAYSVELVVKGASPNCRSSSKQQIIVNCNVLAQFNNSPQEVKEGESLRFQSSSTGATNLKWRIDGTEVGTGTQLDYSFNQIKDYLVVLEASNAYCSATASGLVKVKSPCGDSSQQFYYQSDQLYQLMNYSLPDGGLLCIGRTLLTSQLLVMRLHANGTLKWAKKAVDIGEGTSQGFTLLEDGNYAILFSNGSQSNATLTKMTQDGTVLWTKQYPLSEWGVQLYAASSGKIFVQSNNQLFMLDKDGNQLWNKRFNIYNFASTAKRNDNSFFVMTTDWQVLIIDENGEVKLNKKLDFPFDGSRNYPVCLPDNGIAMVMHDKSTNYILRLDNSLNVLWAKKVPGLDFYANIGTNKTGDLLFAFNRQRKLNFTAITTEGTQLWTVLSNAGHSRLSIFPATAHLSGWAAAVLGSEQMFIHQFPTLAIPISCYFSPDTLSLKPVSIRTIPGNFKFENVPLVQPFTPNLTFVPHEVTVVADCRIPINCPVEICDNGKDDNDDGLIDCADPTCKCEECSQLPDGVITGLDSIKCLGDSLKIYLKLCNKGRGFLRANTPIAFYKTDPTNSNAMSLAGVKTLGINLLPDSCTSRSFVIKAPGSNPIFVVLNDDYRRPRPYTLERFQSEQYPECNYLNNKFQFTYDLPSTPKLDLGPDQLVCANSVTVLRAPSGFARYRWFEGSSDSTFTAFSAGTYWIDAWDACGNKYSDSIHLKLQALGDVELGPNRNICAGDTLHLSISGFTQLKWWPATGMNCDTCKSIIAKPDTTIRYYVTARRGNCFAGDSVLITVNAQPKVDLGPDRTFCSDTTWQLIGPLVPGVNYRWNTGATTPSINVNQTGAYALEVRNAAGCAARDTTKFSFNSNFTFDLGMDTTLCTGKSIRLPLKEIDADVYRWSTAEQSASIEVREAGLYILEGTKDNCSWRDSIEIILEDCNRFAVYVPNVMSTTSAVNAQFHPFFSAKTELVTYQFDIYDRWGEMVFRSQDAQQSWDGRKNGQWCNQGVYVWTLRVRYRENGLEKETFKAGEVLLMR